MTLEVKPSKAKQLWFAVLISVLAVMYLETRQPRPAEMNFLVHANAQAEGAKVYIDGNERGVLTAAKDPDLSGALFRDKLAHGKHILEVKKPGFEDFRQVIPMSLEAFVKVDLVEKNDEHQTAATPTRPRH